MDGPRDYHTKWSKSDRGRQVSYDIAYMQNLKKNDTNELITKQKQTHRRRKQIYGYQRGKVGGRDKLGVWDWHIHTTILRTDNQQRPTI